MSDLNLQRWEAALCLKRPGPNGNGVPQDSSLIDSWGQLSLPNCLLQLCFWGRDSSGKSAFDLVFG